MIGNVNKKSGADTDLLNLGLDTLMEKVSISEGFFQRPWD